MTDLTDTIPVLCPECGEFVLVPRSDLSDDEAKMASTGKARAICAECKPPAPPEPEMHEYRVEIRVQRDDIEEDLIMVGGRAMARNITKAWPTLTTEVSNQWARAQSMSAFAEQEL